jgi:COMM domain containing 4
MKFRFCGDQDAPEWVLRECATLARLSAVRVRVLSGQVCGSVGPLGAAAIDPAKVARLTASDGGTDLTPGDVKSILAALRFVFFQGAKHGTDHETLQAELMQLGLPREHAKAMARPFRNTRDALRAHLAGQTLRASRVEGCRWRTDLILASSSMGENVLEPVVQLQLQIRRPKWRGAAEKERISATEEEKAAGVETVAFEVSGDKFRLLLTELQAARRAMDS